MSASILFRRFSSGPVILTVLACSDILGPGVPPEAVRLSPLPASFAHWWTVAEACSGLSGNLSELSWWTVPGYSTVPGSPDAAGEYVQRSHAIVLADGQEQDGHLVRHEMLHALLAVSGESPSHPKRYYENRCGGVVSCSGPCAMEIGGPPAEALTAPPLTFSDQNVSVEVIPDVLREADLKMGCFTIVVSATNTGAHATSMNLDTSPPMMWAVDGIGGGSGGGPIPVNPIVLLQPGDSRRYAFDCPAQLGSLSIGEYVVRGRVGIGRSNGVTLRVVR